MLLLIALTQVQGFELNFVESHEIYNGPFIQPVKVSLDGIPFLPAYHCTVHLAVRGGMT